jgi:hypothetical protein
MNQLYLHIAALENQLWELSEVKFQANFRRSKKKKSGWMAGPTYRPRVSDHYPGIPLAKAHIFEHLRDLCPADSHSEPLALLFIQFY